MITVEGSLATARPESFVAPDVIPPPPSRLHGEAFAAMCRAKVCADGIDTADAELQPGFTAGDVQTTWEALSPDARQDPERVALFAKTFFHFPKRTPVESTRRPDLSLSGYSRDCMLRSARTARATVGSQIGLPYRILPPGGRFDVTEPERGRTYGWDRWPTYRGAILMGAWGWGMLRSALGNAKYIIRKLNGNDPNGNATYFQDRSQPPVAPRLVRLLAEHEGPQVMGEFLESMVAHFQYWNEGADDPDKLGTEPGSTYRRVVRMPNGAVMYRFYDDGPDKGLGPRDEMYAVDLEILADYEHALGRPATDAEKKRLFTNIRATAEHGEDFTVDLCEDGQNLYTLNTIDRASVKLNALQAENAQIIAAANRIQAENTHSPKLAEQYVQEAIRYETRALELADCIEQYCLTDNGWLADFNIVQGKTMPGTAMNGVFALSAGIIRPELAIPMLETMEEIFLHSGGFVNTLHDQSTQQWDNTAWPIMQLEAVDAAVRYGRYDLALKWCDVWLNANDLMYQKYGCLFEKSDPNRPGEPGNGGEYDCVKDLLMSHGVDMALRAMRPHLAKKAAEQAMEKMCVAAGQLVM